MVRFTTFSLALLVGYQTAFAEKTRGGAFQIGQHHQIIISSDAEESQIQPVWSEDGKTETYTLDPEGASYISVHFSAFDLPPSCSLDIHDGTGHQSHSMNGRGKFQLGAFWGHHINGDRMDIDLTCEKNKDQALFRIDEYVAGNPFDDTPERKNADTNHPRTLNGESPVSFLEAISEKRKLTGSICGSDDKRNAVCYQDNETVYSKARAVARLFINGSGACTGWLVSESNILITNEHCIASLADVQNTDFEFMAEESECTDVPGDGGWFSHRNHDSIFDGAALLAVSAEWDYAVVQLTGNPASQFGFLELENRRADVNEDIFIPQHPGGRPKEIGIADMNEADGRCKVMGFGPGCAPNDMKYSCDTEGGSSGSPVLSRATNKVIALHHCGGGCNGNLGAPIYEFYDEISEIIEQGGSGTTCENAYDECEDWADSGDCLSSSQYSDWMEINCELSCNMCSPVAAPVSAPVAAPVSAPVAAPVSAPVAAPVSAPVAAPVSAPVAAPVSAPVAAPVSAPVAAPVSAPVAAPVSAPVAAPVSAPVAAPTMAPSASTCENVYDDCEGWADYGFCLSSSQYSDWMEINCELSCNMCSPVAAPVSAPVAAPTMAPSASTCENVYDDCKGWADYGFCLSSSQYSDWMEINCEESCNMC